MSFPSPRGSVHSLFHNIFPDPAVQHRGIPTVVQGLRNDISLLITNMFPSLPLPLRGKDWFRQINLRCLARSPRRFSLFRNSCCRALSWKKALCVFKLYTDEPRHKAQHAVGPLYSAKKSSNPLRYGLYKTSGGILRDLVPGLVGPLPANTPTPSSRYCWQCSLTI